MKPNFSSLALVASALCGNLSLFGSETSTKNVNLIYPNPMLDSTMDYIPPEKPRIKNRAGLNQRQKRKNSRRAWAAGNKKAFKS